MGQPRKGNDMKYKQVEGGTKKGKEFNLSGKCYGCGRESCDPYYDGRTKSGPWGWFCKVCFRKYCTNLGVGSGQKYEVVK